MYSILKRLLLVTICGIPLFAWGTHNRAGEITYVQLDDLSIECTVTTYTKESSTNADRDSILVNWGDGTFSILFRSNGPDNNGESLGNDIKKNIYIGRHTYPGRGTYTIGMQDPNRVADVVNIPNSVNVKFYISTTLTLLNNQFQGQNSSAILLEPPIDFGCVGQPFTHNPNASDPDGDSLSFELIIPFQGPDTTIKNYEFPDQILPGPDNVITLNERTGEFKWNFPQREGEFNIAFRVNEYRKGQLINSIIRDMQIEILACENAPPLISAETEICVVAGDTIDLNVTAIDLNARPDQILLTSTGGAFDLSSSPATFEAPDNYSDGPVNGRFLWYTNCNHIRNEPYTIVFKAVDQPQTFPPLSDLHTLRIKVVGPPPQEVQGEANQEDIIVSWASPYRCEDALDDYFYGFSIWRRIGHKDVIPDTCNPGLEGQGYTLLDYQFQEEANGRYFYRDETAEKGRTYCYRVLAEFARKSPAGFPFNFVESLTSEEVCLQLSRDQPLILNVDVRSTNTDTGRIYIRWTRPVAEELDTIQRPGPYVYRLERRPTGIGTYTQVPGAIFTAPTWSSDVDTTWMDQNLNTVTTGYEYQVDFTYGNVPSFRTSEDASSIYLNTINTDRQIMLNWSEDVPWDNLYYDILMENDLGDFDTLGRTSDTTFLVDDLTNGETYCFKVLGYGDYGLDDLDLLLLNHSQVACGVPIDSVAPCAPEVNVTNPCDDEEDISEEDFYNVISWNDPTFICEGSEDLVSFIIYFRRTVNSEWIALDTIMYGSTFEYTHLVGSQAAGCYSVTSVDSVGNESKRTDINCVENCPLYELPNTFTPNGNGQNDLFVPRRKRFIDHVEFSVFNRWGQLVFETEDPEINWDGTNLNGEELADGTYFYSCVVFESHYDGILRQDNILKGYIELIRSQ
ncbi:MAG: gliding motility-associated C-terminal domain-containing protein [Saprospiraceae bacterium]|nr:gliding motility-associated C-terminal domain-containing protein [Saprospiraceae bacterium]